MFTVLRDDIYAETTKLEQQADSLGQLADNCFGIGLSDLGAMLSNTAYNIRMSALNIDQSIENFTNSEFKKSQDELGNVLKAVAGIED